LECIPVQCLEWENKFNPQINLPFNFLIQKYFFHHNPTWNINYWVKSIRDKRVGKKELELKNVEFELINLRWNWNWPNGIEWNWN